MSLLYKPDFIVAGPAKTGTTWLYHQLQHIDEFKLPPAKEVSFFTDVYQEFITRPENKDLLDEYKLLGHDIPENFLQLVKQARKRRINNNQQLAFKTKHYLWGLYYSFIPRNTSMFSFKCYSALFTRKPGIVSGDISPLYFILRPQIISLIAQRFPEVKIVFILRDPVEREWSNIRMNNFARTNSSDFSIQSYLQKHNFGSDYQFNLENWEKHFDKARISYLFYDDLQKDPHQFINSFINIIKPGATIHKLIPGVIGKGVEKPLETRIKLALLKKNLPQYDFLATKFGPASYPAFWKEKAMEELQNAI